MVEIFIITLLVVWSCIVVFKKVLPKTANRLFNQLATACQAQGWHTLAKRLAPKNSTGCGGSCSCGDENQPKNSQEINTVKWK